MTLLQVEALRKTFPVGSGFLRRSKERRVAVDDVTFSLERGQTLALVGESGAGKSTTGRMILRLIDADGGSVTMDGVDLRALSGGGLRTFRRRMQMIFQDPYTSFDPRIPIGESVGEPLRLHLGMGRDDRDRRVLELLERVGMGRHHLGRYPRELSGGQLQRAAVARALTVDPELIVCDEPVAALDVSIRAQVLNLLKDLQEERGMAYLFISHDLALVEVIADEVAVMKDGRIVEVGAPGTLYHAPQHPYTKELLAAIPRPVPKRRAQDFPPRSRAQAQGAVGGSSDAAHQ